MKLVTFQFQDGRRHIGALRPGEVEAVDLTASGHAVLTDMLALMDGGPGALDLAHDVFAKAGEIVALSDVRLLSPVPEPRALIDCITFEEHMMNAGRYAHVVTNTEPLVDKSRGMPSIYRELPIYYKGNRFSVVGADADIVRPSYCEHLDYELEFGAFLGQRGANWSVEEAADAIFGYAIYNDVSARDQQIREMRGMMGPSKGKDFDTGNVIGPWLVTKDEIDVSKGLQMRAWINGELVSDGNSSKMMHTFPQMIAYWSKDETRMPGEFIGSGTVGSGCALENGHFLKHGDVLEIEVEGLGRQRNRVVFPGNLSA